jgi:CRP-like cAMP-binding protein
MATRAEKVKFPLLELLPPEGTARALKKMSLRNYAPGETIYERGEDCTDAFFVFEGRIKTCAYGPGGEMAFFFHRKPGGMFGFYSAITGKPQTSTADAVEKSVLGRMTGADFMETILGHRGASEYMLKLVTGMLRAETNRITNLIVMEAPLRVVAELLEHLADTGSAVIDIPARAELAVRLGMTRETLARHLSGLSKKGLIAIKKDKIQILQPDELSEMLG